MDHLIFTAVSGATRSLNQQKIHANNLTNVNTQGFRADLERASSNKVAGYGYDTRYLVRGQNAGVDMSIGETQETGRDLDIAIIGDGLIAVRNGRGEAYTRNGQLEVSDSGNLTVGGMPVLGDNGPIILPDYAELTISADGTISVIPRDGDVMAMQEVERIKLVDIPANRLNKNEQGLLVSNRRTTPRAETVEVVAQHLEGSNISAVSEMVSSIALNRQFEAQIKMMKVAEELAQTGNRLIRGS